MTGFKTISMFLLGLLVLSCLSTKQEALVDTATALAMQEELTETVEVVVWLRNAEGRISSHWVKNDVSGVIVVASRRDAVLPVNGALWRFPTEDDYADYDEIELVDLVSGEILPIALEADIVSDDSDEEPSDAGTADTGDQEPQLEEGAKTGDAPLPCRIRHIQSLPTLLGAIGPYLFFRYNEKLYDCDETLMGSEDHYVVVDLVQREVTTLMSADELDTLKETPEVMSSLAGMGGAAYTGSIPVYDGNATARVINVFSNRTAIVQENGDRHYVVDAVEILGNTLPKMLAPFETAPDLVTAFAIMYPMAMPAGWRPIRNNPEEAARLLTAFGIKTE